MSVTLIRRQPDRETIQEALHDITAGPHPIVYWYESDLISEHNNFYDQILGHLHNPDTFKLTKKVTSIGTIEAYSVNGVKVPLSGLTDDFLVRTLFALTKIPFIAMPLFASIRLSGGQISCQTMCCAAGVKECYDKSQSGYTNKSGYRFSWFRLLLGLGFSVVSENTVIRDIHGNSILDIVADWNVKDLLRDVLKAGITTIEVSQATRLRFLELSLNSKTVRECLQQLTLTTH